MNKLPLAKRVQILAMLCDGVSMRSISRLTAVSINTVTKLLVDAGETCLRIHDKEVRHIQSANVQCDEIWSSCYAKQANIRYAKNAPLDSGEVWTWTAIDAETKLIVSYYVADRTTSSAIHFIKDLRARLSGRVQLSTDGHRAYLRAIDSALGDDVDYTQLNELYGPVPGGVAGCHSPPACIGDRKEILTGYPDMATVSTSYVERANLTMRMSMRRFTRSATGFSKKIDNHVHALALYFAFYNFTRIHKTLKVTPAMAAGIADHVWSMEEIAERIEADRPAPGKRGPYKMRQAE